jgi:hypothetical protein
VRRTAVLVCALASFLIAVPVAVAHPTTMVTEPGATELVAGEPVQFSMHGDRIPPGSDVELKQRMRMMPRLRAASMPTTWCGIQRSSDDTLNASFNGPRIKVVYAYPYDQPNRFDLYKDLIQSDVASVSQWVATSSGGVRTIRFDTGTNCGADYVDIAVVRLPRTLDAYDTPLRANYVMQDVDDGLTGMMGVYDTLIYADGLYADDNVIGSAQLPEDDTAGAANDSNVGGATAMIWGDSGPGFIDDRLTTFLHEVSHNLGAVQYSAPNSTGAGHCNEMYDVMCYADGGPQGTNAWLTFPCGPTTLLPYECGADDYFNPAPAPGTYLATHWNVYDSVFMCALDSCIVPKSGSNPNPPPPPNPNPTTPDPGTAEQAPPAPDPGTAVPEDIEAWLDNFMVSASASLRRVGLRGLAKGKPLSIRGQAPSGYAVQFDLMMGAAAIAGGALDSAGKARLKVPRVHRRMLAKRRKVRFTLQGVIRGAAGGGPPSVKRVAVTLKAPAKKKKRRR